MSQVTLPRVLICLSAISIAAVKVMGGDSNENGVIRFKGPINWAWATRPPSTDVRAEDPNVAKRAVIFSNFGTRSHLYEDTAAWDVAGPDSGVQQQSVAMPFTPRFAAQVSQISVAVEHASGSPNSFVLSLNADNGGQTPGKVIRRWIVSDAPEFGTCCNVDTVDDVKRLIVSKGIKFWVVATTSSDQKMSRMEWDLSPDAKEENFAFNNGQGWYQYTAFTSAFAIYGREIR